METFLKTWFLNPMIGKLVAAIVGVLLIWSLAQLVKRRLGVRIKDTDNRYRTKKLMDFFAVVLMAVLVSVVYSDKLGSLTVAFGVAGAGIAFALQEVIASVAGWLAVMFGGFYRTGDRVQLGGIKGDVIDIGVIRTTVMEIGQWVDGDLYNGRIVRIANSFVFKEPVFNYSADFPFLWDEIKVPVMFGSDYEAARSLFQTVVREVAGELTESSHTKWNSMLNKYMIEDARTSPWVTLAFNDNWVEFTLRYVVSYKTRRSTKDALYSRLLPAIEASNGKVKLASATFHLVEAPVLNVNLTGQSR